MLRKKMTMSELPKVKNVVRPGQVWTSTVRSKEAAQKISASRPINACSKRIETSIRTTRITSGKEAQTLEEAPREICDVFENSYDIVSTNRKVLQMLSGEMNRAKKDISAEIESIKSLALKEEKSKRELLDEDLSALEAQYDYICTGKKLSEYQTQVKSILEDFVKLTNGSARKVVNFCSGQEIHEEKDVQGRRISLIFDFARAAKRFVNISITMVKNKKHECTQCGTSLLTYVPDDRGMIVCPTCFLEKKYVKDTSYVETLNGDVQVKNKKTRSEYHDITNFKKIVDSYQGKNNSKLPSKEEIVKQLDSYFAKHKLPSCQETQAMKPDLRGRRGSLSMSQLFEIFVELGHVEYGEDAWLISNLALGWELPDLSKYEVKIYSDYQKTQAGLSKVLDKGRSSSIGRHFRLFKHLELAGYPCVYREDFKVSKMKDTLRANEELWKKMCDLADDESIYYIPTL